MVRAWWLHRQDYWEDLKVWLPPDGFGRLVHRCLKEAQALLLASLAGRGRGARGGEPCADASRVAAKLKEEGQVR
jgi:hypothetical protein